MEEFLNLGNWETGGVELCQTTIIKPWQIQFIRTKFIKTSKLELSHKIKNICKLSESFNIFRKGIAKKELKVKIEELIERSDSEGLWKCKQCGKTVTQKSQIKYHVEAHIIGVTHRCKICGKSFNTRFNLQQHLSDVHAGLFCCDICGNSGMSKVAYRMHRQRNHREDCWFL